MKRVFCFLMTAVLLSGMACLPCFAAADTDWIITDPYAAVDWDTWSNYKFQPHCHTNASDGYPTIHEFVQTHYDLDYDIVALTDHGTLNRGWNRQPDLIPLVRLIKKERTQMAEIHPLTEAEYSAVLDGTAQSDVRTHKNGMLDVPLGIELNMATPFADCHLTGYFSEYGQGLAGVFGDYETPSKGVRDAGGISMLSHVGEYVYIDKDSEKYVGQKVERRHGDQQRNRCAHTLRPHPVRPDPAKDDPERRRTVGFLFLRFALLRLRQRRVDGPDDGKL